MHHFLKGFLILCAVGLLAYAALIGLVYYWEVSQPAPGGYDCIIVLGAQVKPDGTPSVQLEYRLDTALKYYRNAPCPVVSCGARGSNEPAPEGDVMREWLIAHGADPQDMIAETGSENTKENIANAWSILRQHGCTTPLIVTSDYHLPRALAIARSAGLTPEGAGSPCRRVPGFWLKNHCREALAWVKFWIFG